MNSQPVKGSTLRASTTSPPVDAQSQVPPTPPMSSQPTQSKDQDPAADLQWGEDARTEDEIRRLAAMMTPEENVILGDPSQSRIISFRCTSCGQVMNATSSQAGTEVRCGNCAGDVQVPAFKKPEEEPIRSARVTLPVGRNKRLRTADDIRKASGDGSEAAGGSSDLDEQFQELIRRELERLQTGESPTTLAPTLTNAPPKSETPLRKKPLPPLAEHGEVVPVPGQAGPINHPRPNPSLRSVPMRAADAPLPPLVTMDTMDLDSEVARNWGEHAVVPTRTLNWLAALIILSVLGVGGYYGYKHFRVWAAAKEAAEAEAKNSEGTLEPADSITSTDQSAALASLQEFHEAVSAEAKSVFVRNRGPVGTLMKAYYDVNNVESRLINQKSITIEKELQNDRWFHKIHGEYADTLLPFHADLEETADGRHLLDWKSWVGYCETPLATFAENGSEDVQTFRLRVAEQHYYRDIDAATYRSYLLKDKNETIRLYGYAQKDSPAGKRLISMFRDLKKQGKKQRARLMLSIRFGEDSDKRRGQVIIEDLVNESWIEDLGN
ncbi:MAG: phage FluMu protein Com [Verrucomicrobiales bacterium]|jgi:phage FluMu protein Com